MVGIVPSIVKGLTKERDRLNKEIKGVAAALAAFGKAYGKAGRKRQPYGNPQKRIVGPQNSRSGRTATEGKTPKNGSATRRKRTLSAATRNKIAKAQRSRWAKIKANAKKNTT